MSKTKELTPTMVRRKRTILDICYHKQMEYIESAKKRMQEIEKEMQELQAQCPHSQTEENYVQDVGEMKLRTCCKDCGAIV